MTAVLIILLVIPALVVFVTEYRRAKRLEYMARAEKACARFGRIRHELVMAFSSGAFREDDQKAFRHMHVMCTQILHIPQFLREFSSVIFVALAKDSLPTGVNGFRPGDLSPATRPYLERLVHELDGLIQEFSHPLVTAIAALGDTRVLEIAVRLRDTRREVERRRHQLEGLRNEGTALLAA